MKTQINEIKRMQQLAGILKEGTEQNQAYFNRYTLLDPNEGKNIKVTAPFTIDKIASAILPLADKQGEGLNPDNLVEFKGWLKSNIAKYSNLLRSNSVTARDLFDNMYGDYVMDVNDLNESQLNEDTDVTYGYEDDDNAVDSQRAIEFIRQTLENNGYNIPDEVFEDMYRAAYEADFLSVHGDKPVEYYQTFNEEKAMETARKYINGMIEDGDLDAKSIEDFKQ